MKKYLIFLFTSVFVTFNAQTSAVSDAIRADYQSALSLFENQKYEEALDLVRFGFAKSQKLQDKNLIAYGYFYQARYYEKIGPYTKSVRL